ncbi:acyl-[ACP]--phospholipid O-acyltransferase [Sphingomonas immobilis]|uniref:Acyl-[ACP]--phospholipid O-acyltransferase n=1 Tax=Sphingomonas immobilis TaxID=3063997 RepID=A0ABT9A2M8_9SPHN|nr:acyl-[ACP]--phospholipid O-acyltransferase [Sphingomonas sp. CA1-15]MDO7843246.1 acyl-[ACP]--phospholipid O-acyltransferase [Sphingomonas sp. CA1-15]
MSAPDFSLLAKRRYGPLFVVQFFGAFNDNVIRFGMIFLATYGLGRASPIDPRILPEVALGLFMLPYFLFSALAGQIADAIDKGRLIRIIKAAEIGIMAVALTGFWLSNMWLLLAALLLLGVHSTFFGPVKYSILPQHLGEHEMMGGTGLIEAGTFLAILAGQLLASNIEPWLAASIAMGCAVVGWASALAIPAAPPSGANHAIDYNIVRGTWDILRTATKGRGIWLAVLGISWFFAVGGLVAQDVPVLVKDQIHGDAYVVDLFLVIFSVAIGIGSLAVNRLLKGEVSARYVPVSALLMAAGLIDLWIATNTFATPATMNIHQFLADPQGWHVMIALTVTAFGGGMFVVPLYAIISTFTAPAERSRVISANNVMNGVVSVVLLGVMILLARAGTTVPGSIGALGFATLAVALISCWLLPETVIKSLVRGFLKLLYRVEVEGTENMPKPGERAVVVVNHVSWLDGLLLAVFLPGKPVFAVHTAVTQRWWMKPALKLFHAFPVDPTNPMSAKAMVRAVKEGNTLVIFPEGRITVTGALMKVFDGPGMVADKADAPIVPVRIDGAQLTPFSYLRGKVRTRMFPKITLTVLPPRRFHVEGEMTARQRRAAAGRRLYDEMSGMIFATSDTNRTLFEALLDAKYLGGAKKAVVEDVKREPLTYSRLITASIALGRALEPMTKPGEAVGVLLPNVSAVVVTFFGLQATGRVPAMLNYTAGLANLKAACTAAEVRTVLTARAFVTQGKLEAVIAGLEGEGITVRYLEDISGAIGTGAKLRALIASRFAHGAHRRRKIAPDSAAVILFTSGSEGLPKGVVLTHRNLLANCLQLSARIDFNGSDMVLNALPVFHSFGLTGGTLLPIFSGVKTLLYPNPLHYRIVPALAYDSNATILFGTDTFLAGYARMAHNYDFYSVRYVFAGAERVRDETRKSWMEKFGLRIFEGYGATEAGPVIAVNTPMHFQSGSVGRLLPGIESKLDAVPGITEGGKLSIKGPNVMAGYMKADQPGVLQPPEGGWHDTGDIVTIDNAGFVTIRGRAKRFAKIGGEMVSLPAVEGYAAAVWPEAEHAVVTRPDAKKGEQLVLFTTKKDAKAADLQAWGRANGIAELAIPRDIRVLDTLPVLGTGKTDYVTMGAMAAE